jgi:alpha-galactosidase
MGEALRNSGHPIVYSLCEYGEGDVWKWGPQVGANLWRTTGDIGDSWKSMTEIGFDQGKLAPYAAPGHWNDPDMLEVGNGGMNGDEYRTHMTLWSILAAPLLAGNDLRTMTPEIKSILMNREVIAVDQDPLGKQGQRLWKSGDVEIWSRPLAGGAVAVAVFNRGEAPAQASLKLADLGSGLKGKARDLWAGRDVSFNNGTYSASMPRHGVVLLRIQ